MVLHGKLPIPDLWAQTSQINAIQCWMANKTNTNTVKMTTFYPQDSYYAGLKENEAIERAREFYKRKKRK